MNEILFITHTIIVSLCALFALKLGKDALISYMCLLSILSNLFITKQITLFGCAVTGGEVFAVGAIFSFNLLQEFFGKEQARKTILINFTALIFYLMMSQIHLWYTPNHFDTMQSHFASILEIMPRITLASITVYIIVQMIDSTLYHALKKALAGRFILMRNVISLVCSQVLDTTLFTYLALYGVVGSPVQVIIVSIIIKLIAITSTAPFILLAKKLISTRNHDA